MRLAKFLRARRKLSSKAQAVLTAHLKELMEDNPGKSFIEIIFENWDAIMELIELLLELFGD